MSLETISDLAPVAPVVRRPGEAPGVSFQGITIGTLASARETGGVWSLFHYAVPPGCKGAPPHWHRFTTETFYVLSGQVTFTLDGCTIEALPGTCVLVPPGTVHTLANRGRITAALLVQSSPGGFEDFFRELAGLMAQESTWEPADPEKLQRLAERYDTYPAKDAGI